jgi:hypothetical protein
LPAAPLVLWLHAPADTAEFTAWLASSTTPTEAGRITSLPSGAIMSHRNIANSTGKPLNKR